MFRVKMKRHLNKYIFLLLLSFTAILIHGYQFGVSDQEIFIPYILKTADPSLFQNDILFTQPSANASLFYSFFGFLIEYFNIELVFFIGYLVFQFLFFDGIYRLSRVIFNQNLAYLTLIFLFRKYLKSKTKRIVSIFIGVALVIFLTNYIVLEIFRIPLIAQLQLVRSIAPIAYIALAIAPLFLIYQNLLLKTLGVIAFGALSLNLFYVFLFATVLFILSLIFVEKQTRDAIPAKEIALIIGSIFILHLLLNFNSYKNFQQKIQFPKQTNDWIEVQKWAKENTFKNDVFLVPPNRTGFRIFSQRPMVGDIKDGAVVIYSPSYANYWRQLMDDLENYYTFDEEEYANLQKKYQNEYVVTLKEHNLNFLPVYKNDSFNVFKID